MAEYLKVLHEDNHLIAVFKPAGILVQGDETGDQPLSEYVKEYIKYRYKKPGDVFLGTIHRLDRPVSGVVVFARTSKALTRMNQLFRDRKIKKTYWAITRQRPNPINGHLKHYLLKDRSIKKTRVFEKPSRRNPDAKLAELDYKLLADLEGHHLLEILLHTGRPHQIRAQLAEIGCPIKGDVKYGYKTGNEDGRIHLHSRNLSFIHPVSKEPVNITSDLPNEYFWNFFKEIAE